MCNKKIPDSESELLFYYRDVILYYENTVKKNSKGYSSQRKAFVNFLNVNNLHFVLQDKGPITIPASYKTSKDSFIYFKSANKHKGQSRFVSFLFHLRNSFAHGHFMKLLIDGCVYLCLEDYNAKGMSMIAQIPINKFPLLLELIKSSKLSVKNQNNKNTHEVEAEQ